MTLSKRMSEIEILPNIFISASFSWNNRQCFAAIVFLILFFQKIEHIYSIYSMFKIPMGNSLQDCENVTYEDFVLGSAQEVRQKQKTHTILGHKNRQKSKSSKAKSQITSIQNFRLERSSSQASVIEQMVAKYKKISPFQDNIEDGQKKPAQYPLITFKSRKLTQKLKRTKNQAELREAVSMQKINCLKRTFIQKLKRNNIYSQPVEYKIKTQTGFRVSNLSGIEFNECTSHLFITLFSFNYISLLFVMSVTIALQELQEDQTVKAFETVGLIIYFVEIVLNLVTKRFSLGRKLEKLGEISEDYAKESMVTDLISFVIILLNTISNSRFSVLNVSKVVMLFKIPHWFEKIKKIEVYFIQNYYKEQYWELVKVFLFNFLYAHILAVILLCMANVSPDNNWITSKGLDDAEWYQKYVWSYYWSTTIMLTIGFGDITPSSYKEALVMIFIETISCVILAYNINCVGTLISNIRLQDEQKHKNLKIFKKLVEKNKVSEELSWKINNFIEEHSNIKKLTNIDEEAKFVENLPPNYKLEYLKESNKSIFKGVYFFNSLMEKTLCALAENIKAKITHPLEVLLNKDTNFDLLILKDGQIGCKSNKESNSELNFNFLNKIKISSDDRPFLLHTNFITNRRSSYKIISTMYSLLYYLNFQNLGKIIREYSIDFELYCQLKDKCKYHVDEFQVFTCNNCKTKHTEFDCPKYHFMPLKQHVVHKYLSHERQSKNMRQKPFLRTKFYRDRQVDSKFYIYSKSRKQPESFFSTLKNLATETCKKQEILKSSQASNFKNLQAILSRRRQKKTAQKNVIQNQNYSYRRFQEKLTQTLKLHLGKILQRHQLQDEVWLIQSDRMKNYKMYFTRDNPQRVEEKFSLDKRHRIEASLNWDQLKANTENNIQSCKARTSDMTSHYEGKSQMFSQMLSQFSIYD